MKLIDQLLELLYPTRCAFCHKLARTPEEKVCRDCIRKLPYVPMAQKKKLAGITDCVSPFYYRGDVRASLHRYKFGGVTGYAEIYADFLVKCIDENEITCDSITWAPLSRRRLRRRGYDQARLLAEALAVRLGVPCEPMLVKARHTPPQSRTNSAAERRKNVAGVYRANPSAHISGKRILLIDDIVTTGSTLCACAAVLKEAGAAEIAAATVARTEQ